MTSIVENIIIRRATFEDLKEVYAIEKEAFGKGAYPTIVYLNSLLSFPSLFLVAELDGQVIGYDAARIMEGGSILGEGLAVKEEYRRRGIGTKLLQRRIEVAKEMGFNAVYITYDPTNKLAASLFKKFEFTKVGEYALPDRNAVELKKELKKGEKND